MNIWNFTTRAFAGVVVAAIGGASAAAQTCDGQLTVLPEETDSFESTLTLFDWTDIPVSIPAWSPQGSETLVKAVVTFGLEIEGTLEYTNLSGATCPVAPWSLTSSLEASSPFPLMDFPIMDTFPRNGQFTNVAPAQTAQTNVQFVDFVAGPFEFKDADAAGFIGNPGDMFDFLTTVDAVFSVQGCSPQNQASDLQARVVVSVQYTVCEDMPPPPPPGGCACREPSPHYRRPGSLLLYPEFDNREGDLTLITITNADCSGEDVDVEFMYIDADDCSEFNTTITLTPCDTYTALTNAMNPNMVQGYVYAFAKDDAGNAITHNGLIGSAMVISGIEQFDYSVNPVAFLGMTADRAPTDLDDDGIRDLDGAEYDRAPDTITIPRFLGQGVDALGEGSPVDSHLILIGLSGGQDFETTICFDVYNDNEEGFSGEYTFDCWEKPTLLEVRGTFANSFLRTTDHDPDEILGAANRRESGWICIDGCFATSAQETIADPAFYAVLVERIAAYSAADLPFECGTQDNGALLPRGLFGDGDPNPVNNDNQ